MNHQVGRSSNQRKQTHTARKRQRHKQTARVHVGTGSQTHHDRKHQSHCTRIADKASDTCGNQHHQQEKASFTLTSQFQNSGTDHLGQARLEDSTAYHKQAHHHDDNRVGKTRQSFCRSQNLENQQSHQSTQRNNVRADFTMCKKGCRYNKNSNSYPHNSVLYVFGHKFNENKVHFRLKKSNFVG